MTGKLFFILDTLAFFAITWLTVYMRHGNKVWDSFHHQLWTFVPVFLFASFVLWLFSFYDVKLLRKQVIAYRRLTIAFLITLAGSASVIYFVSALPLHIPTPRRILIAILLIYFAYVYLFRRNYFKLDVAKTNLLFFGDSPTLTELVKEVKNSRGFNARGYETAPVAGKRYSLRNLDMVIIGSKLFREQPQAWDVISSQFIAKGAVVDTDFNAYEQILRRVSRESIEDSSWLLRGIGNRHENSMYGMLKRTFDLTLALCLLPILAPLGCFLWLLVRVIDGEKPIFKQKRVGLLGKEFNIYKFRTILSKTQESEQERLTKTGPFLRRFRLDEIPQIINVLRGDISFVGPRPLWIGEWAILNHSIPHHTIRTIVKPGITGWAQLNFKAPPNYKTKNGQSTLEEKQAFDAAFTRFSYDVWYIKNRTIGLDLDIMIKTGLRMFIKDSKIG